MSKEESELREVVGLCAGVSLNIGTAAKSEIRLFQQTAILAADFNKSIVLDPVGIGASAFRLDLAWSIITKAKNLVLKLNGSEALALLGSSQSSSAGVDSTVADNTQLLSLKDQLRAINQPMVVTGAVDLIFGPDQTWISKYGHTVMTQVSGMGCVLGGMIAAFAAVTPDLSEASLWATVLHGVIGEQAAHATSGPGSFTATYLDTLASANIETLGAKVEKVSEIVRSADPR